MSLKLGIQLFSVREEMAKSVENTIRTLADIGYGWSCRITTLLTTSAQVLA